MATITFLPDDRTFVGRDGTVASDAAVLHDIFIEHPCGARGRCTRCRIRFLVGAPPPTPEERRRLSAGLLILGWRLSCQARVSGEAVVEVPPASRATSEKSFGPEVLPGIDGRPGAGIGAAVDLGSTTVAAALVDLDGTRVLAHASRVNGQVRFGGDVISRIRYAMDDDRGDERLTEALRATVAGVLQDAARAAGIDLGEIASVVACGNGAMSHSFAGSSVVPLGSAPYRGAFTEARTFEAVDLGLPLPAGARVWLLPQVASHVGGDTVAAILATGMHRVTRPELLIDLGTNTEIVLATSEGIEAVSAAAGPAFEGGEIVHGMRADAGAVDWVSLDPDEHLSVHVVGGGEPMGVCGTGLVDLVALLLEVGILEPSGRLLGPQGLPTGVPSHLARRVLAGDSGDHRFVVAEDGVVGKAVALHALDVRALQLVKASILAGARLLFDRAGIDPTDLRRVYVAGAFGSRLRKWTALRIGLLPAVDPERIRLTGDAAAAGARLVLCDPEAPPRAAAVAKAVRHVELATHPGYTDAFAAAIPFPERFPDV